VETDWQWTSDNSANSILNLSTLNDKKISGTGTGNIDVRLYLNGEIDIRNMFDVFNKISSVSISNTTSTLTEHSDYEIEFLEDGFVELEIRDVDLSSGWYNITLNFYDPALNDTLLQNRQADALEGIENKTGTFHLDVDCPLEGVIGRDMVCTITAYVEDSQLMEKEVDFTCWIYDSVNEKRYSQLNFNKMITREISTMDKSFAVPRDLSSSEQYLIQCEAGYYNLGSRTDSFYDTFRASLEEIKAILLNK